VLIIRNGYAVKCCHRITSSPDYLVTGLPHGVLAEIWQSSEMPVLRQLAEELDS
jgi:hypothetical protein